MVLRVLSVSDELLHEVIRMGDRRCSLLFVSRHETGTSTSASHMGMQQPLYGFFLGAVLWRNDDSGVTTSDKVVAVASQALL